MPPAPDPTLLEAVERCIVAYEQDGDSGLAQVLDGLGELAAAAAGHVDALRKSGLLQPPDLPTAIGGWRIVRRLGSGGMGTVYLGEQTTPLTRRAAIKVIRRGMDSREVLARFAIERQALAMLEHPGIARVLEAGSTDDGRPFLVMDHVAGTSLLRYCDEHRLGTRERLELFVRICGAVQHAHVKGLLHRDLKPSNILVTERDGHAEPVVIDFGVAKSVGKRLHLAEALTLPGHLLGTPEYMSPEQALNEQDVDTRTDVYSLGVVLYELLCGTLPFDAKALRQEGVARLLRDTDVPTPSTRLTTLGAAADSVALARRTNIGGLRRSLRGDLDRIVLKALDRDREQRYPMPAELAADIQRHLRHEPISAATPGTWYRVQKFCARNRVAVAAGLLVLLSLGGGLVASLAFYGAARRSGAEATASLGAALAAVGELVQVGDSDLVAVPHLDGVRRDLLGRAVAFYADFLQRAPAHDPQLAARTLDATRRLAELHYQLGELDLAASSLDDVERLLGAPASAALPAMLRDDVALDAWLARARILDRRGEPDRAAEFVARAIPVLRAAMASAPADETAARRFASALAFDASLLARRDPNHARERIDEALTLVRAAQAAHPEDAGQLARLLDFGGDRANLLRLLGEPQAALDAIHELLALRHDHPGRDTWPVAQATLGLSSVLDSCERPDEVLALTDGLEPTFVRLVADHPPILAYRRGLLQLLTHRGNAHLLKKDPKQAQATLGEVRAVCEAGLALSPDDLYLQRQLVIACINVAVAQSDQRRYGGAWQEAVVEEALTRGRTLLKAIPAGEPQREVRLLRVEVDQLWALLHESRGELTAAEPDLGAAIATIGQLVDEAPDVVEYRTRRNEMQRRHAALLLKTGRVDAAVAVTAAGLADSEALRDKADAQDRWRARRGELLLLALQARARSGDAAGAFAALAEYDALRPADPAVTDWIGMQDALQALARIVADLPADAVDRGRYAARARELLAQAGTFAAAYERDRRGNPMVAVMLGNTLVLGRDLEATLGELAKAADYAGRVVDAYAVPFAAQPSPRNGGRLRAALASWLGLLHQAGDTTGVASAVTRAKALLGPHPALLAELAEAMAELGPAGAPLRAVEANARR